MVLWLFGAYLMNKKVVCINSNVRVTSVTSMFTSMFTGIRRYPTPECVHTQCPFDFLVSTYVSLIKGQKVDKMRSISNRAGWFWRCINHPYKQAA